MELILPSKKFENSYIKYIEELGDEERYPFPMDFDYKDFDLLLEKIHKFSAGIDLPEGYVPSSTWWLVEDEELIGVTNIRHCLNSEIKHCGGHMGMGIRPSYRRRGLGKRLMRLSIEKLYGMGVGAIHIHCYRENSASSGCIVANGGVLESEITVDEKVIQRYLVKNT